MKLIILAAGYATRLYPLTLNQPKPLLPVAGKPMVDHVLASLGAIDAIDEAFIVTNEKFAGHFEAWAGRRDTSGFAAPVRVVNDHSTGDDKLVGPGLSGVYARAGSRTSLDADAYIEQSLREPQTFLVPEYPAVMPSFDKFSDGEVLDLIAYLKTLN